MIEKTILKIIYAFDYRVGSKRRATEAAFKIINELSSDDNYYMEAFKRTHDEASARDALTDAALAAGEKPRKARILIKNVPAYFYVIVRNKAVDAYKKKRKEQLHSTDPLELQKKTGEEDEPIEEQIPLEYSKYIKECRNEIKLSPVQKEVLELREAGKKRREIAEIMGLSIQETGRQQDYIKRKLKRCILRKARKQAP